MASHDSKVNRRAFGWLFACVALLALACGDPSVIVPATSTTHTPNTTPGAIAPEVVVGEGTTGFVGLQAFDARSGQSRWKAPTDPSLREPQWVLATNGVIYTRALDDAYAFAADDGAPRWHRHMPFLMDGTPVALDGTLYGTSSISCDVTTSGACIYALDADSGATRWTYATAALYDLLDPQMVGGVVYTTGQDGTVYALRAASGALLWRGQPAGAGHDVFPSLLVAGSTVYVGGADGRLYALDAGTGATRWSYQSSATNPYPTIASIPRVTLAGTTLYVATDREAVVALDAATGAVRWTRATQQIAIEAPVLVGGTLYATTAGDGVYALDPASGAVRWHALAGAVLSGPPTLANGMLYCVTFDDGIIHTLDAGTGAVRWQAQGGVSGAMVHDVGVVGIVDGVLVVSDQSDVPSVSAWDAATGAALWRQQPSVPLGSLLPAALVE